MCVSVYACYFKTLYLHHILSSPLASPLLPLTPLLGVAAGDRPPAAGLWLVLQRQVLRRVVRVARRSMSTRMMRVMALAARRVVPLLMPILMRRPNDDAHAPAPAGGRELAVSVPAAGLGGELVGSHGAHAAGGCRMRPVHGGVRRVL